MQYSKSVRYYKSFTYRVEKKISVQDYPKMKDYAKNGVYLYIIHDTQDNNRFLFFSSLHYEENTKINPETFILQKIADTSESIHLSIEETNFGIKYFEMKKEKADFSIILADMIYIKGKDSGVFKQFKTHNKKIAIDNPNWYIEFLKKNGCKSLKKRALKLLLCENKYNYQIVNHCISTFFQLHNPDYQKFNDHSFVLDQGKTGKSSLIGYMGEKVDNVSMAGLYGSSDGLRGKFRGGLVTLTTKAILIDEVNELVKSSKGDKILSVLNSLLENGCYNYVKQFSQQIFSTSQFFFMGNVSDAFNFPTFLIGCFGNVETLGRRIGIITYNDNLNGFEKGQIREFKVSPFLNAISIHLSNQYNLILCNRKFIKKLYDHKEYIRLSKYYENELKQISENLDDITTAQFIKSHSKSIDRIVGRSLKLWLFNHIDDFVFRNKKYDNHTIYEVLQITKSQIDTNIINFKNIAQHIKDFKMSDKSKELNAKGYDELNQTEKNLLKVFYENRDIITIKGVPYSELQNRGSLKQTMIHYKKRGITEKTNSMLLGYGLNLSINKGEIYFRIVARSTFNNRIDGIFGVIPIDASKFKKQSATSKIEKAWDKNKSKDDLDMGDLN